MRRKEEILKDKEFKKQAKNSTDQHTVILLELALEVLLDIRDLLNVKEVPRVEHW